MDDDTCWWGGGGSIASYHRQRNGGIHTRAPDGVHGAVTTCGDDAPAGGSPSGLPVSVGTHGVRPGGCP